MREGVRKKGGREGFDFDLFIFILLLLSSYSYFYFLNREKLERILVSLFQLHAQPLKLFETCLEIELWKVKEIGSIMREQSSTVRIVQYTWRFFSPKYILHRFTQSVGRLGVGMLMGGGAGKEAGGKELGKLKSKVKGLLKGLLVSELLPTLICVMCYRCAQYLARFFFFFHYSRILFLYTTQVNI